MFFYKTFVTAMALLFSPCAVGQAAEAWSHRPFQYVAVDQGLRDVLAEMATNVSVPIAVSEAVHGQVHGHWTEMAAGDFLDQLAKTYGLVWYFDGALLSVSTSAENTTKLLPLRGLSLAQLRSGMTVARLIDPRFELREGPAPGTAVVSGPPRFLAMVQQSLDAMANAIPVVPTVPVVDAPVVPERTLSVFRGSQTSSVVFR